MFREHGRTRVPARVHVPGKKRGGPPVVQHVGEQDLRLRRQHGSGGHQSLRSARLHHPPAAAGIGARACRRAPPLQLPD